MERRQERRQDRREDRDPRDHRGAKILALAALAHHQSGETEEPQEVELDFHYQVSDPNTDVGDQHQNPDNPETPFSTLKGDALFWEPTPDDLQVLYGEVATTRFSWKNPGDQTQRPIAPLGSGFSTSRLGPQGATYPISTFHSRLYAAVPAGIAPQLVTDPEHPDRHPFLFLTRTIVGAGDTPQLDDATLKRSVLFAYPFPSQGLPPEVDLGDLTIGLNEFVDGSTPVQTLAYKPSPTRQEIYFIGVIPSGEVYLYRLPYVTYWTIDEPRQGVIERANRITKIAKLGDYVADSAGASEWSLAVSPNGKYALSAFGGSLVTKIQLHPMAEDFEGAEITVPGMMNALQPDLFCLNDNRFVAIWQAAGRSFVQVFDVNEPLHRRQFEIKAHAPQPLSLYGSESTYSISACRMAENRILVSTLNVRRSPESQDHILDPRNSDQSIFVASNDICAFLVSNDGTLSRGTLIVPGVPQAILMRDDIGRQGERAADMEQLIQKLAQVAAGMEIRYDLGYHEKTKTLAYSAYVLSNLVAAYPDLLDLRDAGDLVKFLKDNEVEISSHVYVARIKSHTLPSPPRDGLGEPFDPNSNPR